MMVTAGALVSLTGMANCWRLFNLVKIVQKVMAVTKIKVNAQAGERYFLSLMLATREDGGSTPVPLEI